MITEYCFTVDGAELVYARQHTGRYILTVNHRSEHGEKQLCSMIVSEKDAAEREFFNHFGDDSSWPPGWWARLTEGKVTKKRMVPKPEFTRDAWARENYAHPPQSWQEYYEVSRPTDRWLKGVKL